LDLALAPATPRDGLPAVNSQQHVGSAKTIKVPLFGLRGIGLTMTVDAAVWEAGLASGWPKEWTVLHQPHGDKLYVVSTRTSVNPDRRPVPLARLVAGALPGEIVLFRDGNAFNLCASNLFSGKRAEINKFVGARRTLNRIASSQVAISR
jgi:hypothetical protein